MPDAGGVKPPRTPLLLSTRSCPTMPPSFKRGKLQSPFTGRHEPINPEQPVLYARYTPVDGAPKAPLANGTSPAAAKDTPGVPSARKKRRLQGPKGPTTPEEPAEPAKAQPAALPKEYNNKEQAQSFRNTLGEAYIKPEAEAAPSASGRFTFGFQVPQGSNAGTAPHIHVQAGSDTASQPSEAAKKPKKKRKGKQQDGQAETAQPASVPAATSAPQPAENGHAAAAQAAGPGTAAEEAAAAPAAPFVPRRVFVGGMPFSMEEQDVREFWEECGEVAEVDLMRFPDTGRFKGIAFITFADEEGYQGALGCDGETHNDVRLKVEPCRSGGLKRPQKGMGPAAAPPKAAEAPAAPKLEGPAPKTSGYNVAYVGNIAFTVTAKQLEKALEGCSVAKVRLHTDPTTHRSKGFAHVHFEDEASLDRAVGMDGLELNSRELRIGFAQPKKKAS